MPSTQQITVCHVEVAIISESHKVLAGSLGRESYFGSLF
jgi:hypothetical protein